MRTVCFMADRRPLASRGSHFAIRGARFLTRKGVTPNAISMSSVGFAAMAFLALWTTTRTDNGLDWLLYLSAAAFIQLRLIANLMDGMVAIEGGKSTPDGAFWNEAPDRVADLLILTGAGLAVQAPALGLLAACGALLTAYVRELGRAEGQKADFSGPMAKQHRMAVLTVALIGAAFTLPLITAALWLIVAGTALTVARRSRRVILTLRHGNTR